MERRNRTAPRFYAKYSPSGWVVMDRDHPRAITVQGCRIKLCPDREGAERFAADLNAADEKVSA